MTANLPAKTETIPIVDRTAPDLTVGKLPPSLRNSVASLSDDWPNAVLPAKFAITAAERSDVERHCAVLAKALIAGPADRIGAAIAGLKIAFPAQRLSDEEFAVAAKMFRQALGDLPAWCVERSIQFWLRGEHPEGNENYAFAPSAPQLRRLALIAYQKVSAERHDLRRLLDATVEPERTEKDVEMKARIDAMVAAAFSPKQAAE